MSDYIPIGTKVKFNRKQKKEVYVGVPTQGIVQGYKVTAYGVRYIVNYDLQDGCRYYHNQETEIDPKEIIEETT